VIVAVTGATGYVGRFIVERLIQEGASVRAWRRPGSDLRGLSDAIAWIEGDLASPSAVAALVDGADVLVHAALEHAPGRYRGGEGDDLAGFLAVNVGGSLRLLAAARAARVGRCVVLSSRAVFGDREGAGAIAEDAAPRPTTHYGAAKAALEAFVQSFGLGEGWPIAALRPTGVYGLRTPPEASKWFHLVADILAGKPIPARAASEVHGRDVAAAVWCLLDAPPAAIAGIAFNCSDIVVSTRDIAARVQRLAQVSGPLPEAGRPPAGVMGHARLAALGVRFGGWPLFEQSLVELVAAVRAAAEPAARQSG
jgi:nucleoside-diphosphate-sugar epimerase